MFNLHYIPKIIHESEAVPFGYGYVCHRWDYDGREIMLMPFCWIKKLWLNLLRKSSKRFEWEKKVFENRQKVIIDNLINSKIKSVLSHTLTSSYIIELDGIKYQVKRLEN